MESVCDWARNSWMRWRGLGDMNMGGVGMGRVGLGGSTINEVYWIWYWGSRHCAKVHQEVTAQRKDLKEKRRVIKKEMKKADKAQSSTHPPATSVAVIPYSTSTHPPATDVACYTTTEEAAQPIHQRQRSRSIFVQGKMQPMRNVLPPSKSRLTYLTLWIAVRRIPILVPW
jgi:hypothetical protein